MLLKTLLVKISARTIMLPFKYSSTENVRMRSENDITRRMEE
jgi:hypothetical protein